MDFILEIFLQGFIANKVGPYSRYIFFILIGRKKTIKYLSGEKSKDLRNKVGQNFSNTAVGMTVFSLLCIGVLHLIDSLAK